MQKANQAFFCKTIAAKRKRIALPLLCLLYSHRKNFKNIRIKLQLSLLMDYHRKKTFEFFSALYYIPCCCSELHFIRKQIKNQDNQTLPSQSSLIVRPTCRRRYQQILSLQQRYLLIYQRRNKNKWPTGQPCTTNFIVFQLEMKNKHYPASIPSYYPTQHSLLYEKSRFDLCGYPGSLANQERKGHAAILVLTWLRRCCGEMCECWPKVILNSCALRYNTFIMQKKQAPGLPPFNPFIFPFPFPFPPPPFMNPMMNMPPKGTTGPEAEHLYPPSGMPMPSYPYPPFPMMYPPPPEAFFRYHQSKNAKDMQQAGFEASTKEKAETALQRKRKSMPFGKQVQQKPSQIIILSDDQENKAPSKPTPYQKPDADTKINMANMLNYELKPKRTERKIVPAAKPEPTIKKTRQIQKKTHSKLYREKQELKNLDLKQAKYAPLTSTETAHEHFNRSTRIKYLTIKDGKGKIMIGEEFQASITPFLCKDQYFTIWVADRKNQLLSRFHKDGL